MASRFELRPWPYIVAAYLLAPLAAATPLWLLMLAIAALGRNTGMSTTWLTWIGLNLLGLVVGLPIELVVVTPLLIGFHRYRWRWLNGWTGAGLGFLAVAAIGLIYMLAMGLPTPQSGPNRFSAFDHGVRTPMGWFVVIAVALFVGPFGVVPAWVLRLVAVRRARSDPAIADTFD